MSSVPAWGWGALAAAVLGVLAILRQAWVWLRTRLDSGEIVIVSRSGERMASQIRKQEAELQSERERRIDAQECARCADESRDVAQERLIAVLSQLAHLEDRDDDEDQGTENRRGARADAGGGSAAAGHAGGAGVLRGRGRGE